MLDLFQFSVSYSLILFSPSLRLVGLHLARLPRLLDSKLECRKTSIFTSLSTFQCTAVNNHKNSHRLSTMIGVLRREHTKRGVAQVVLDRSSMTGSTPSQPRVENRSPLRKPQYANRTIVSFLSY